MDDEAGAEVVRASFEVGDVCSDVLSSDVVVVGVAPAIGTLDEPAETVYEVFELVLIIGDRFEPQDNRATCSRNTSGDSGILQKGEGSSKSHILK